MSARLIVIAITALSLKRFLTVKKRSRRICSMLTVLMLSAMGAVSQTYIGPSLNIGNLLEYTPLSPGLGTPPMPSGSIVVSVRKNLNNDWALLLGANAGIIGYSMVVSPGDTLS